VKKTIKKRDATLLKQLILDSAKVLFSKKGFQASSMNELSTMTDLNKAMIFHPHYNLILSISEIQKQPLL
jgi:AcrR family transcriptional regulator